MISLNHIGIAVNDLPRLKKLLSILNLKITHSEKVADQGVEVHFVPLSTPASPALSASSSAQSSASASSNRASGHPPAQIELLEVDDPQGVVARFIQKRGPGVHHLSFLLDAGQLLPTCEELKKQGFQLTYDQPRIGAHRMKINFIHPASSGGILIELTEKL